MSSLCLRADELSNLRARVTRLERENFRLRQMVTMLSYMQKAQNGVERSVQFGKRTVARLRVARHGWKGSRPEDVAAVCHSCAKSILEVIRPAEGRELSLVIVASKSGPMALFQRGPSDEYLVLLNVGARAWAQLAYQFAHELGHVMCEVLPGQPQHWFEEAFCESLSLWTLDRLGKSWKTDAPYPNWKSYAKHLSSYSNDVRKRSKSPKDLSNWFATHKKHLTRQAYDRDKNLIVAVQLAERAHQNADFYRAFYHMRDRKSKPSTDSMKAVLTDWVSRAPKKLQFAPKEIAKLLGIPLSK